MKASISLDALFDFLQSLQLSADNKTWLAEKLIESARESRQTVPGQMSVNEAKDLLKASEERFERGNTSPKRRWKTAITTTFWHTSRNPDDLKEQME